MLKKKRTKLRCADRNPVWQLLSTPIMKGIFDTPSCWFIAPFRSHPARKTKLTVNPFFWELWTLHPAIDTDFSEVVTWHLKRFGKLLKLQKLLKKIRSQYGPLRPTFPTKPYHLQHFRLFQSLSNHLILQPCHQNFPEKCDPTPPFLFKWCKSALASMRAAMTIVPESRTRSPLTRRNHSQNPSIDLSKQHIHISILMCIYRAGKK